MKMVKYVIKKYQIILILFTVIFCINNSTAQVLYSEIDTNAFKYSRVIKLNLTQLITNEIVFSYEHFIYKNRSVEAGLGYVNPASYLQSMSNNFYYNGFLVNAEYKMFGSKGILKDFYFAPMFRYKFLYYDNEWVSHNDIKYGEHDILETSDKQTYTLAALIGVQRRRQFVIDVYLGMGFRYYYENTEQFENIDKYNMYYWRPNIEKTSAFFPTFHFGVRIGLDFNK